MLEDGEMLAGMLSERGKGVFYLCGPTWPVPDVYQALVGALVEYEGQGREEAEAYIEGLKEEERYVLEVRQILVAFRVSHLKLNCNFFRSIDHTDFMRACNVFGYTTYLECIGFLSCFLNNASSKH